MQADNDGEDMTGEAKLFQIRVAAMLKLQSPTASNLVWGTTACELMLTKVVSVQVSQ